MAYPREVVQLTQPFPETYVHTNPSGGGSYIKHHVIEQRLIQVFGRPPTFERVEIVYGDVAELKPNPNGRSDRAKEGRPALKQVIVGVVARMTVTIAGQKVVVEEVGDCEQPHNWDSDGQRLKDAFSDAYKRCAMRLGCGLHLYSGNEYFLHEEISKVSQGSPDGAASQDGNASVQRDDAAPADSSKAGSEPVPPGSSSPGRGSGPQAATREAVSPSGSGAEATATPPAQSPAPDHLDYITSLPWKDVAHQARLVVIERAKGERVPTKPEHLADLPAECLAAIADKLRQGALV